MRQALFILFSIIGLSYAAGCAEVPFIPTEAVATLQHPTHVEAYRTGTLDDHPGYGGKLDGYAVFGTGSASGQVAADLTALVTNPATYHDEAGPPDFVPTVGFRFYRRLDGGGGQMSVDVLVGFDHDQILLVARDGKLREIFRRMMESDPGRPRLLELSRQAFPFDDTVQSLALTP